MKKTTKTAIQTFSLCSTILLLALTTCCTSNTRQDNKIEQPADTTVQADRIAVIQDLCWSLDGRYIYFSAMKVLPDFSDYSPQLWTVYRFAINTQRTVVIARSALNVAVSPSGEQLAVAMNTGKTRNIYLLDKNGKNPTALVTGDAKISAPTWSPDGKQIAFVSTMNGTEEIYTVHRDGSNITRLTDSHGHRTFNPAWSPDGIHIAYYLEKGDGQDQIHVMKADGTEDRNITNDTFNNIFPGWIDNTTIIYGQGHQNAPTKAFQINIHGTDKKQVLQLESMYTRYSPDGSKIAYIDEMERSIKLISSAGKPIYRITLPD